MEVKTSEQPSEKAAAKAHEALDRGAEQARKAEGTARDYYEEADRRLREKAREGRERGQDFVDSMEGYVREHPLTAIGLAVVVGALLPSLLMRNR